MKISTLLLISTAAWTAASVFFPTGQVMAKDQHPLECRPTPAAMRGPFYKPDAPVRDDVGDGYLLTGEVKSALDCSAIEGAEIEFWQANPEGEYDKAHRATVLADEEGRYRLETDFPGAYGSRPPHIHIRVSAQGYETLVAQHYPEPGTFEDEFDLVLTPARSP